MTTRSFHDPRRDPEWTPDYGDLPATVLVLIHKATNLGEIADALFGEESALGDAIARRAWHVVPMASDNARLISDAILAMPEMQAIRRVLWVLNSDMEAQLVDGYHYTDAHDEWHRIRSTSPALAEWVRTDP